MTKDDALIDGRDIPAAIALMTRLPMTADFTRGARAAWAYPLAGVLVAGIAGCLGWLVALMGATPGVIAGVVLVAQVVMCGGLHEDGLADTADGLWGGHDKARRLEIMKDSRIGSYGVLALGLSLILRWTAITSLVSFGWLILPLMVAAALSRAPMAAMMAVIPNARGSGLSSSVGVPPRETALLGGAIALGLALILVGFMPMVAAAFWAALAAIAVAAIAKVKIGGQTGDILGATQQVAEIAALAALAAFA